MGMVWIAEPLQVRTRLAFQVVDAPIRFGVSPVRGLVERFENLHHLRSSRRLLRPFRASVDAEHLMPPTQDRSKSAVRGTGVGRFRPTVRLSARWLDDPVLGVRSPDRGVSSECIAPPLPVVSPASAVLLDDQQFTLPATVAEGDASL